MKNKLINNSIFIYSYNFNNQLISSSNSHMHIGRLIIKLNINNYA